MCSLDFPKINVNYIAIIAATIVRINFFVINNMQYTQKYEHIYAIKQIDVQI